MSSDHDRFPPLFFLAIGLLLLLLVSIRPCHASEDTMIDEEQLAERVRQISRRIWQDSFASVDDNQAQTIENFFARNPTRPAADPELGRLRNSSHTNNWAILVSTSRFWFNYRHVANALSIYRTCKRLGIPDSHIILMLADDMPCNPRNSFPGVIFNNENHRLNLYGTNVEVDYRGYDVTVQNFIRVLTGRHEESVPRSKRLLSDDRSNILVFMTGHGGDGFLKFQDADEISSTDIADAFEQMHQQRRYNEILFIVDTCQANSMYQAFYSPNIIGMGSSNIGENSYAHHHDRLVGVSIIDRYTYYLLEFFEKVTASTSKTIYDLHSYFSPKKLDAHPGIRSDLIPDSIDKIALTDFFGSVGKTEILATTQYPLSRGGLIHRPRSKGYPISVL